MAYADFVITKGSAASDVNGGGPNLGVNDGPVDASNDCTSDGAGTSITDNNAGGWATASVDDWICFDTAGTKDFARITNITGEVLTVTPAVALGAANKNVNVGGAWSTWQHGIEDTITTGFVNSAADPPRINIKYSATAWSDNSIMPPAMSVDIPLMIEGYETTFGDGCPNGNRPKNVATTSNCIVISSVGSARYLTVKNLYIERTSGNGIYLYGPDYLNFSNIYIKVSTGTGVHGQGRTGNYWEGCYVEKSGDGPCWTLIYGGQFACVDCVAKGGTNGWVVDAGEDLSLVGCIGYGQSGDIVYYNNFAGIVKNCVFHGSTGGSGIRYVDNTAGVVSNCIFYDNNQYGIECDGPGNLVLRNNAYGANGVAATKNAPSAVGTATLTGDPFTNAASGDFSLNDTAGAGAACRAAGFPGALIHGGTGFLDIGALQHEDAGGGGGGGNGFTGIGSKLLGRTG